MKNKNLKIALMDSYTGGKSFTEGDNFIHYARGFLDRGCSVFQLDPYKIDFDEGEGIYYQIIPVNGELINVKAPISRHLEKFDVIMDLSDVVDSTFAENLNKFNTLHINDPLATYQSADKRTYVSKYGEFIPKTFVSSDLNELEKILFEEFGGKMVVKDPFGSGGKGVELVTKENLDILKEMTNKGEIDVVAQKFMDFANEGSKRVAVIGNVNDSDSYRIIHFYGRHPGEDNWKDNLSQGGNVINVQELTSEEKDLCLNVARKSELYTVGLDIMNDSDKEGNKVPRLVETNSVLAFSGGGKYTDKLRIVTDFILDELLEGKAK